MPEKTKLICPVCSAEMNHHAMKVDYETEDSGLVDPVFGGVLKEAHYCPHCGHTELQAVHR